jgi:hypothetical protein
VKINGSQWYFDGKQNDQMKRLSNIQSGAPNRMAKIRICQGADYFGCPPQLRPTFFSPHTTILKYPAFFKVCCKSTSPASGKRTHRTM